MEKAFYRFMIAIERLVSGHGSEDEIHHIRL